MYILETLGIIFLLYTERGVLLVLFQSHWSDADDVVEVATGAESAPNAHAITGEQNTVPGSSQCRQVKVFIQEKGPVINFIQLASVILDVINHIFYRDFVVVYQL